MAGKKISNRSMLGSILLSVVLVWGPLISFYLSYDHHLPLFEELSIEQQELVKQEYLKAKSLYMQGKFDLVVVATKKIHKITQFYSDSKQVEEAAKEAVK